MIFRKSKTTTTPSPSGLWQRLQTSLSKTRTGLLSGLSDLFGRNDLHDDELLDEIETRLLLADVGIESTTRIMEGLRLASRKTRINTPEELLKLLHKQMVEMLGMIESPLVVPRSPRPFAILMIGVNGVGKTTTIGKLAHYYTNANLRVLLAAGDTFRAAAVDQLKSWGNTTNVPVISQSHGADSAAVIYDGLRIARKDNLDIIIADTAGRLHNKNNLMEELKKIRRTINKFDETINVETILVLDAGNGQNALAQARQFHEAIGVSGIIITKLDGTAKGGIIFALADKLGIPVRFVGTGEQLTDLAPFNAENFVTALLTQET